MKWFSVGIGLLLFASSCQSTHQSGTKNTSEQPIVQAGSDWTRDFISIDSINPNRYPDIFFGARYRTRDTITPSNWKVEYKVKNDSTIDQDIYIRISKGQFENIYKGKHVLKYRTYFIPRYLSETDDVILMEHGCATDCSAITLISKQVANRSKEYRNVVSFNEERGILIYLTDSTYTSRDKVFQIGIVNLNTQNQTNLTLNNRCTPIHKPSCIDTIIYREKEVEIVTLLQEDFEHVESSKKVHVVNY